jgi:hypothetical protein
MQLKISSKQMLNQMQKRMLFYTLADGSGLLLFVTPQSWEDGVGVQKGHLIRLISREGKSLR